MRTSKPLKDLVPDILTHIRNWKQNLEFNFRLYKILEGQIRKEIEDSLSKEIISKSAYNRCVQRIPSLNILQRTTSKLSKIYVEPPRRKADNKTDVEIMERIAKESKVNVILDVANKFYNGLFSFALEPFIEEGMHKVRVLSPHQFLVYSDSKTDPSKHTVFIKFLGSRVQMMVGPSNPSRDGTRQDTDKRPELVDIFALYSDTEFLVIDSNGGIRADIMAEMRISNTSNPVGRIPFVYCKRTVTELMPYPNQPGFDFSILIPKLLTDLNYAAQFCSHSITWTKNVKLNNQELNPDAIVDLGDSEADGTGDPEIGTINPTVDVPNQLSLIEFQFNAHLDSLGIKANTNGSLSNGRDASGIAKAIDEGDISSEKKSQVEVFSCVEYELWSLMADMQRVWTGRPEVIEKRVFSESFKETFGVEFCEVKLLKSFSQKLEEVKGMRDLKLATRSQAIKMLHPDWSDSEVDAWVEALDKEAEDNMQSIIDGMGSMDPEQKSNGQFNDGNQQGAKQTPESRPNQTQ
jgi:hypothetical protein